MAISIPKGTHDIIKDEARGYDLIEEVCANVATVYGFDPLRTPIFESTDLFSRSVGESSDIVNKEMYTFLDKGNRSITLRPEGTAGIVRSIISNKLHAQADLPLKYYYSGPMFRYERPQLGRYRQFHQFGVESIGVTNVLEDVEVILMGVEILRNLGFKNITLKINSLGDALSRANYKSALQTFFKDKIDHMCPDCKNRYAVNPLRILDCKVPEDQEVAKNAPKMKEFLSDKAKDEFKIVLEKLDQFEIPYVIDDHLVRGLDYYSGVIFEFSYVTSEGKDYGALGGGGHYDRLVKELDGPNLEGVGFAFGIERLYSVMRDEKLIEDQIVTDDIHIMSIGDLARADAIDLGEALRSMGLRVILNYEDKALKALFKRAERAKAKFAVIIGEDEVKNEVMQIKDLEKEEQVTVPYSKAVKYIVDLFKQSHEHGDHCGCGHDHGHDHDNCGCGGNCGCGEDCDCEGECDCGGDCSCGGNCSCGDDCDCNGECDCDGDCSCGDDCHCHNEKQHTCKCKDGGKCDCEDGGECTCGGDCDCKKEKQEEYCACGYDVLKDGECSCGHHHEYEEKESSCGCGGNCGCGGHDH